MSPEGRPLAIDLFTGLHGWADGLVAEGWEVIGFDLEDMSKQFGQPKPKNFHLVLQDVLTLHGSQFRRAGLLVASPPCQFFSYTAMPWKRAKALAEKVRSDPALLEKELALFKACFRIQHEASEAAGHKIPLVVENVRGAQPWVGRPRWMYGSFALFGDVPALMPMTLKRSSKNNGGSWFNVAHNTTSGKGQNPDGRKNGNDWFGSGENCSEQRRHGSKSNNRKAASAMIAKIPIPLARWIAAVYRP